MDTQASYRFRKIVYIPVGATRQVSGSFSLYWFSFMHPGPAAAVEGMSIGAWEFAVFYSTAE